MSAPQTSLPPTPPVTQPQPSSLQSHLQKPSPASLANHLHRSPPPSELTLPSPSHQNMNSHCVAVPPTTPLKPQSPSPKPHCAQQDSARGRNLTYSELARCFQLPINDAARELGVCVTALKKQCRKHGVPRWPHRKLKSLDKLKEKLEKEEATAADKEYYKHEIHSIVQKKDHIFRSAPNMRASVASGEFSDPQQNPFTPHVKDLRAQPRYSPQLQTPELSQQHHLIVSGQVPLPVRPATAGTAHPSHPHQALPPHPLGAFPVPAPHVSLCGILGCNCCVNGGVSSQNYHTPLTQPPPQIPAANTIAHVANVPPSMPSTFPSNTAPFYGPAHPHYAYPAQLPYPPPPQHPFQNVLQVNLMEQPSYPHHASSPRTLSQGRVSQATPSDMVRLPVPTSMPPTLLQNVSLPASHSRGTSASRGLGPAQPYEVFGAGQAAQTGNGYLYSGFLPQSTPAMEGRLQASQSGSPHMVPQYWAELGHASSASNVVTMYKQSSHYHHYTGENVALRPVGKNAAGETVSSATNDSDAMNLGRKVARSSIKEITSGPATPCTAPEIPRRNESRVQNLSVVASQGQTLPESVRVASVPVAKTSKLPPSTALVERSPQNLKTTRHASMNIEKEAQDGHWKSSSNQHVSDVQQKNGTVKNGERDRSSARVRNGVVENELNKNGVIEKLEQQRPHKWKKNEKVKERVEESKNMVATKLPSDTCHREISAADERKLENGRLANGGGKEMMNPPHTTLVHISPDVRRTTAPSEEPALTLRDRKALDVNGSPGRSPKKRLRTSDMDGCPKKKESWSRSFIGAGNTGVPVVLHGPREVASGVREITPPSEREEGPDNEDESASGSGDATGSGTGEGSGSGSGDGTGSGSGEATATGCGPGSRFAGSADSEEHGVEVSTICGEQKGRISVDPASPGIGKSVKRRKTAKAWRRESEEAGGVGVGGVERGSGVNGGMSGPGNATVVRARRYEQAVHGCVSLGCAQWSTDRNLRVTMSMGSRGLLGLAGVCSHGRVGAERTEGMLESEHVTRRKYTNVLQGQRLEWVASQGSKRFLMVLAPFRRRGDIAGVSGMVMEVTQVGLGTCT